MYTIIDYNPHYHSEALVCFLEETEKDYHPPISCRDGGIEGFLSNWISNDGNAVVAFEGRIVGSAGWFDVEDFVYLVWLGVVDEYKTSALPARLVGEALNHIDKPIFSRTWLSNKRSIKMAKRLGAIEVSDMYKISHLSSIDPIDRESIFFQFNPDTTKQLLEELLPKNI